ncbi:MAG: acyl-CoA thioesterase [Candidatus Omnitrophota bacterium]
MTPATGKYVHRHTILLNETNAMGGVVYFSNFVKWQGIVREMVLKERCDYRALFSEPVDMITHSCSVKFLQHLYFGDVVRIEMATDHILPTSFVMFFEYYRDSEGALAATGEQKVTFADRATGVLCRIPGPILEIAKSLKRK